MPKICELCKKSFPYAVWIEGKKRNLKGRKYCFDCSPFKLHNTRSLDKPKDDKSKEDTICECGRKTHKRRTRCGYCWWKIRSKTQTNKAYSIVGYSCWFCGWDKGEKGTPVLEFHHMNRELKSFQLTAREMVSLGWDRIYDEMQKCCLLCTRCHREVEYDLISKEEVENIYINKWKEIKETSLDS